MLLTVNQTPFLKGEVKLPSSKSYSIRAFMISACGGKSVIINPSDCDDAKVSMEVARTLGSSIKSVSKNIWRIEAAKNPIKFSNINVKESGTVLRFLLPLLSLYGKPATINGEKTLIGRPNLFLNQALRSMGVDINGSGEKESVPISLKSGILKGGEIEIDSSLSSQFISALLIACPRLKEDSILKLKGKKIVSEDYITMTCQILKKSGIVIEKLNNRTYKIKGEQKFKGLKNFLVPSDYGLAAFLLAAGCLIKSDLILRGFMTDKLIQADGNIIKFLKRMGAKFKKSTSSIVIKGPYELKGGSFSLKDCPDLVPIMSILALFGKEKTRLYDIKHARAKESDRISDLREELIKLGAKVTETDDDITIYPLKKYKSNCTLDSHKDHRLAMAFTVLGLRVPLRVKHIECTHKSYPSFVKDMRNIGSKISQV